MAKPEELCLTCKAELDENRGKLCITVAGFTSSETYQPHTLIHAGFGCHFIFSNIDPPSPGAQNVSFARENEFILEDLPVEVLQAKRIQIFAKDFTPRHFLVPITVINQLDPKPEQALIDDEDEASFVQDKTESVHAIAEMEGSGNFASAYFPSVYGRYGPVMPASFLGCLEMAQDIVHQDYPDAEIYQVTISRGRPTKSKNSWIARASRGMDIEVCFLVRNRQLQIVIGTAGPYQWYKPVVSDLDDDTAYCGTFKLNEIELMPGDIRIPSTQPIDKIVLGRTFLTNGDDHAFHEPHYMVWSGHAAGTCMNASTGSYLANVHDLDENELAQVAVVLSEDDIDCARYEHVFEKPAEAVSNERTSNNTVSDTEELAAVYEQFAEDAEHEEKESESKPELEDEEEEYDDNTSQQSYLVEDVINHRWNEADKTWEYLIKWLDYESDENTWEPSENFNNINSCLAHYWKSIGGQPDPNGPQEAPPTEIAADACDAEKIDAVEESPLQKRVSLLEAQIKQMQAKFDSLPEFVLVTAPVATEDGAESDELLTLDSETEDGSDSGPPVLTPPDSDHEAEAQDDAHHNNTNNDNTQHSRHTGNDCSCLECASSDTWRARQESHYSKFCSRATSLLPGLRQAYGHDVQRNESSSVKIPDNRQQLIDLDSEASDNDGATAYEESSVQSPSPTDDMLVRHREQNNSDVAGSHPVKVIDFEDEAVIAVPASRGRSSEQASAYSVEYLSSGNFDHGVSVPAPDQAAPPADLEPSFGGTELAVPDAAAGAKHTTSLASTQSAPTFKPADIQTEAAASSGFGPRSFGDIDLRSPATFRAPRYQHAAEIEQCTCELGGRSHCPIHGLKATEALHERPHFRPQTWSQNPHHPATFNQTGTYHTSWGPALNTTWNRTSQQQQQWDDLVGVTPRTSRIPIQNGFVHDSPPLNQVARGPDPVDSHPIFGSASTRGRVTSLYDPAIPAHYAFSHPIFAQGQYQATNASEKVLGNDYERTMAGASGDELLKTNENHKIDAKDAEQERARARLWAERNDVDVFDRSSTTDNAADFQVLQATEPAARSDAPSHQSFREDHSVPKRHSLSSLLNPASAQEAPKNKAIFDTSRAIGSSSTGSGHQTSGRCQSSASHRLISSPPTPPAHQPATNSQAARMEAYIRDYQAKKKQAQRKQSSKETETAEPVQTTTTQSADPWATLFDSMNYQQLSAAFMTGSAQRAFEKRMEQAQQEYEAAVEKARRQEADPEAATKIPDEQRPPPAHVPAPASAPDVNQSRWEAAGEAARARIAPWQRPAADLTRSTRPRSPGFRVQRSPATTFEQPLNHRYSMPPRVTYGGAAGSSGARPSYQPTFTSPPFVADRASSVHVGNGPYTTGAVYHGVQPPQDPYPVYPSAHAVTPAYGPAGHPVAYAGYYADPRPMNPQTDWFTDGCQNQDFMTDILQGGRW